ncbi:MAG: sensor histidine kinase [Thiobacillus sp.]|nr:sensor histidine kinase [Thiobacillus sp.]
MAKLRPRARIVRTIGDQLISGPEAALIELVKNAFDADSPSVKIKITPPSNACPLGAISVTDNGHGMSYTDVIERWFEPATDDKLQRRYSPASRRMLGAKGIGRFAASRLGTKTVLRSVAKNVETKIAEEILVQIDWDDFSADKYLEDVDIPTSRRVMDTVNEITTGVQLVITDLRDIWSKKRLTKLVRELRRVATPTEGGNEFKIHLDLGDFSIADVGFDGPSLLRELNVDISSTNEAPASPDLIVPFKLQDHADYLLIGNFDKSGSFKGTFTVCRGDNQPQELSIPAPALGPDEVSCGPLNLRINVYDREAESIEGLFRRMGLDFDAIGIRAARQILTDNAGIAIFRNGFRIRPYGEPENDWLELERQRVQDPSKKLGLSQVSGSVGIGDEDESGLIERSSREGLEHTGEFDRLKKLIHGVFLHVEDRRVDFREKAGLSRKKSGDVTRVKQIASLRAVSSAVSKLPMQYQEPIRKAIAKDAGALAASLEEIDEYQKLLQSRASLGLVVAQVIHEGRRILNPMATAAKALFDNQGVVLESSKRGEIFRKQFPDHADTIQAGTKSMSRLFKRLDPVSGRRRGRPAAFSLEEAISSALSLFSDLISENNIGLHIEAKEVGKAYGFAEDFQAALLNVLENAIHWLIVGNRESKNINVSVKQAGSQIEVSIENDGPLIDEDYIPRLFQPGFSLKSDGTGLGLSIAREACRASKGDLLFRDGLSNTCFVILFPADPTQNIQGAQ